MQTHEITSLDTLEVILADAEDDVSVRVTGDGEILINVIDEAGNEKGFFAKIADIVKSPEEVEV